MLLTGADKLDPLSFVAVVSPICGFCLAGRSAIADWDMWFLTVDVFTVIPGYPKDRNMDCRSLSRDALFYTVFLGITINCN